MTAITIKEYYAEAGSRFSNKDAVKIGPVLFEMSEHGGVTPRDVVDAARSTNSPLHSYFEWNDEKAADLFRLEQGRNMLRSINVRYIESGQPKTARAFQVVKHGAYEDQPRQYRSLQVLYGDSAFAASMMDAALDDLSSWKKKYQPYTEMWARFGDAFQQVVNQISEFQEEFAISHTTSKTDDALAALLQWRTDSEEILSAWMAAREQVKYIMDAIDAAEAIFAKDRPKKRACIKCTKVFESTGIGNRMCPTCSAAGAGMDEVSFGALR